MRSNDRSGVALFSHQTIDSPKARKSIVNHKAKRHSIGFELSNWMIQSIDSSNMHTPFERLYTFVLVDSIQGTGNATYRSLARDNYEFSRSLVRAEAYGSIKKAPHLDLAVRWVSRLLFFIGESTLMISYLSNLNSWL